MPKTYGPYTNKKPPSAASHERHPAGVVKPSKDQKMSMSNERFTATGNPLPVLPNKSYKGPKAL